MGQILIKSSLSGRISRIKTREFAIFDLVLLINKHTYTKISLPRVLVQSVKVDRIDFKQDRNSLWA